MIKGDKRGMEMALSTIVILIIVVIVMAGIIFLFTTSSEKFKDLISSFSSKSNVDSVVSNCNTLADTDQKYEYCCSNKTIKLQSGVKFESSCFASTNKSWGSSIKKLDCVGVC